MIRIGREIQEIRSASFPADGKGDLHSKSLLWQDNSLAGPSGMHYSDSPF